MRIAFVTSEFPTTLYAGGGLGTYVSRMATLLQDVGHEVEVFVASPDRDDTILTSDVLVRHVQSRISRPTRLASSVLRRAGFDTLAAKRSLLNDAALVSNALETVHDTKPFDVVQSADYQAVGLRINRRRGRKHVVRCSTAIDLYMACDGSYDPRARAQIELEAHTVIRADAAYAPSALVANHYRRTLNVDVRVIRPPAFLEAAPSPHPPPWLPRKFLFHFAGQFGRRKGTDVVARAVKIALNEEPELTMLWAGRGNYDALRECLAPLGIQAGNVLLSYPLPKPLLYATIQRAEAVVLPSLVDNTPNTVIESLLLGVPVIGTHHSSIDEFVDPQRHGILIDPNDPEQLANAMLAAWRGHLTPLRGFDWLSSRFGSPFRPEMAVEAFVSIASR